MKIPAHVSGPLIGFFFAGTGALLSALVYSRVFLGEPMKLVRDDEGVFRMLTKEEAYAARLGHSEALAIQHPDDEKRALVVGVWRSALAKAKAENQIGSGPKSPPSEELTL